LKCRRYPTHSTIWKTLTRVDSEEIEKVFREDAAKKESSVEGRQICFDGKALRGSYSEHPVRVFEAFSKFGGIVLAHIPLNTEKEHEIQLFEKLLQDLNLHDKIVTADALHCKKNFRISRKGRSDPDYAGEKQSKNTRLLSKPSSFR
jgi:hypothetical protein